MKPRLWAKASILALTLAAPSAAFAQGAAEAVRDQILVTATKKADAENVQEVPLAVTAFGEKQLDALKVRDLESLSYSMPNVQLDDVGTAKGTANFSIRGIGINSSIPSIDPTVGVFVDGMYLGVNAGVVLDIFDLESIEVLRGPQGILFGRNVTGGAVLINTKKPTDEWEASFKTAVESGFRGTGLNYYAMGSVGGPIVKDVLKAKVALYYNRDKGWFKNYLGGPVPNAVADVVYAGTLGALTPIVHGSGVDAFENFGGGHTFLVRPVIDFTPSDNFDLTVRFEHGDSLGSGPAGQNHVSGLGAPNAFFTAPRDSFTFSVNEPGFNDQKWNQVIAQGRIDLGEAGVITNIFGWRDYSAFGTSDIDATPLTLFHADFTTDANQKSEEIRYNNRFFDRADVTLGFYYFTQDISYNERRLILGGARYFSGGGVQDQNTWAGFGQLDLDLTSRFTLNFGARYTHEEKSVVISNLLLTNTPCDVNVSGSCSEDFVDSDSWNNFTPKVGFEWRPVDFFNFYANWTQGVRSGGYNFRNTSLVYAPGPFNEEKVNAYEVGFKTQPGDGKVTMNAAFYVNDISNMQRELNLADPIAGVVQVIRNTADATIWGIELESQIAFTDNFVVMGNLGVTEGHYDSLLFDIGAPTVSPGVVDAADLALKIPRLAPITYGIGFVHTLPLGGSTNLNTRFNFSHRDKSYYTDNNLGFFNAIDQLDASISLDFGRANVSIYGKNLLNEVNFGNDTQLPASLGGGTFSPLQKGRRVGIQLEAKF